MSLAGVLVRCTPFGRCPCLASYFKIQYMDILFPIQLVLASCSSVCSGGYCAPGSNMLHLAFIFLCTRSVYIMLYVVCSFQITSVLRIATMIQGTHMLQVVQYAPTESVCSNWPVYSIEQLVILASLNDDTKVEFVSLYKT